MKGVQVPQEFGHLIAGDEEELLESEDDRMKVPRNGKRKIMPIERIWDRRRDS